MSSILLVAVNFINLLVDQCFFHVFSWCISFCILHFGFPREKSCQALCDVRIKNKTKTRKKQAIY